jgi:hypothetical protein
MALMRQQELGDNPPANREVPAHQHTVSERGADASRSEADAPHLCKPYC